MTEQREPTGPRQNVRLALYALSGNQCAFPECDAPMFEDGNIVGQICHIQAQSPGGPRYQEGLTDEQIHAIENLVLLCSKHHKIVDDHPETYTTEWLVGIKAEHESRAKQTPALLLHRLIDALASEVPDNWWERPAAPVFRLGLASSRPKSGQWTLQIQLDQVDGGDIGKLRFAYRRGKDVTQPKVPTLRSRRKWRLSDLNFVPEGVPLELIFTFWWDGAGRTVTYHWDKEVQFQTADTQIRYS